MSLRAFILSWIGGRHLLRTLCHTHRKMRRPLEHSKGAAHRRRPHPLGRRSLVRIARRHEQPLDVAAEPGLVLRVRDRGPQHFGHIGGDALPRELQRRQRLVYVLAANQREHEAGFLGRRANVSCRGQRLDHHAPPAPAGFAPPPPVPPPAVPPAGGAPGPGAAAAALSDTFVVCPLNRRVGANSPSL